MVEHRIQSLYPRDPDRQLRRQFHRGSQVGLDFHGPPSNEILIHDALSVRWGSHAPDRLFTKVVGERTALRFGQFDKFVDNVRHHLADTNFLQELSMIRRVKENTGGVECDRSAKQCQRQFCIWGKK